MLREAFRRWNAGDFEASQEFMREIEWRTSSRFSDLEPVYRGLEGVRRFWQDFTAPWERIVLEPIDFMSAATTRWWRRASCPRPRWDRGGH